MSGRGKMSAELQLNQWFGCFGFEVRRCEMRRNAMVLVVVSFVLRLARADESVDDRLRRAFPTDEVPLRAPIKVIWKDQGVIVTAQYWTFLPDTGQVRLSDCYVARSPAGSDPD